MGISARFAETSRFKRPWATFVCFFCEEQGHKKSRCPHMRRLIAAGEIHVDWKRRVCLGPAGRAAVPVWKLQGMSVKQTVEVEIQARKEAQMRLTRFKAFPVWNWDPKSETPDQQRRRMRILKYAHANIQRLLEESKKPNRWEEPVRRL